MTLWPILQEEVASRGPQSTVLAWGKWGKALDFCSSVLTLWQLEGNQRLGKGQSWMSLEDESSGKEPFLIGGENSPREKVTLPRWLSTTSVAEPGLDLGLLTSSPLT